MVIVSESLARRAWPGENPVGKRLWTGGRRDENSGPLWQTVIGVVVDVRYREIQAARLDLYEHYLQGPMVLNLVVRARSGPLSLVEAIEEEVRALDKNVPIQGVTTMEEVVSHVQGPWRFNMLMFSIFAAVALGLAAIGLFGVLAYMVSQRRQELGVRMVLGATARDISKLVVRQGMILTFMGMAIGMGLALALTRFVSSLLYEVIPTDPATCIGVTILLTAVASIACYFPARRAAQVDPAISLRHQ